jgi:hypothetical protein
MASPLRFVPSGKIPKRRKKVMQIEKDTKLLKRVWKVFVYVDLAIVTAGLLLLSQYFSWGVFMANFHRPATAATSVQPR